MLKIIELITVPLSLIFTRQISIHIILSDGPFKLDPYYINIDSKVNSPHPITNLSFKIDHFSAPPTYPFMLCLT